MSNMFLVSSFNNNGSSSISGWSTSNVTDMSRMFQGASSFNQPINSWDVSNVTTMERMFNGASSFNQILSGWDVSNVTIMERMFQNSTSFNQSIGSWNVTGVTNFLFFMFGKTFSNYSTTNLDAIYNGWSSLPTLQPSINITFGTIKYTAGSSAGKAILQGTYGWTITDGGI
jgi:surface protein